MSERSYARLFFSRENQNAVGRVAPQGRKERKVFMKKALLIVAMLLAVSPVMATVTINAVNEGTWYTISQADGNRSATIRVDYNDASSDPNVRAFALDMTMDSNCNFWNIRSFKVGENNGTNNGYGIFPGRFRQFINPIDPNNGPNWMNANYNPTPPWADPGTTNTGIGFSTIIAELGYLGAGDVNMPAKSGTLFRVDINAYGFAGTAHLTVSADALRGGIVSKDSNGTIPAASTNLNPSTEVDVCFPVLCTTPTNEVGQTQAAALAVWGPSPGQGFTNINGVGVVNCANLGKVITNDQNCISLSTQLNYTYGIAPTEPNVVGMTRAAAVTALTNAGFTIQLPDVNRWGGPNNVTAVGNVYAQSPVAGTQTCSAVTLSVVSYPVKATSAFYANWATQGKPQCWGYPRQCRGDADGKKQGNYWVGTNDLAIYKTGANKNPITAMNGHCADFDHLKQGNYWVGTNDLAVYKVYANKAESLVPLCGNTSTTGDPNFWYWCLPTGGTCPTSPAGQYCATAGVCPNTP